MRLLEISPSLALWLAVAAAAQKTLYKDLGKDVLFGDSIAYVPPSWNNVLDAENFNRNVSVALWQTTMTNANDGCMEGMNMIRNASFIVYDESFYDLLGVTGYQDSKTIEKIFDFPPVSSHMSRQVHDGTVYSSEANAVFFAELHVPKEGYSADAMPWVWRIDLNDSSNPTTERVYPTPQLTVANGAFSFRGYVYWVQEGNYTVPGGIVRMDPHTLETEVVLNNYYGHRFNSPNDIVITRDGIAFFTDGYYGLAGTFNDTVWPMLTNNVYRWDMTTGSIRVVVGAGDTAASAYNHNGAALAPSSQKIYFGNRGNASDDADGARTIVSYDIDSDGHISNRAVFAYMDSGIVDGIKTDAQGNVYAGVTGGVDVFNSQGILVGKIKCGDGVGDIVVNMAWAGNWFYIVGRNAIYRVEMATTEWHD